MATIVTKHGARSIIQETLLRETAPGFLLNVNAKHKLAVANALRHRIEAVNAFTCLPGEDDSFFVADLGVVQRQYVRFLRNLPRVKPYYAVKCNGDTEVLKLLAALGANFDCASKNEIDAIMGLGVSPSRIVYANPVKTPAHIKYAQERKVSLMTFDNADELYKCHALHPGAKLLIRLATDDSGAICQLSTKFGCQMSDVPELLQLAKELNLDIVGVAFHVGSGSSDPSAFVSAVDNARKVFDDARDLGFNMTILDVGGGFESETFESTCKVLNHSLEKRFPETMEPNLQIIAEPGRYFVSEAFTLATNVIGRRIVGSTGRIYLNDGVYGSLNSIIFDHQYPVPRMLKSSRSGKFHYESNHTLRENGNVLLSFWGPTCDGLDCISKSCEFPTVPEVGDWVYFENTGAYTMAASTKFNGFNMNCEVVYVFSVDC